MNTKTKPQAIKVDLIKLPAGFKKEVVAFAKACKLNEVLRGSA